jgi:hypothetical protein
MRRIIRLGTIVLDLSPFVDVRVATARHDIRECTLSRPAIDTGNSGTIGTISHSAKLSGLLLTVSEVTVAVEIALLSLILRV